MMTSICPNLHRSESADFCSVCGAEIKPSTPAQAPVSGQKVRWELVVLVDAQLYGVPDPEAPTGQPAQTFTLSQPESLIGREGADVPVQVPIPDDPGVSRRHALLIQQPDGGLLLRDLNSANGTLLNGTDILPDTEVPLQDGDTIGLGAWTRIEVRAVSS
jgi:hypothetical protein